MGDPAEGDEGQPSFGRAFVKRLVVRDFRNLRHVVLEPAPRFNLIHGENGHGKTSLIEALYVLATTRSFRSLKLAETILQGESQGLLRGETESFGLGRELKAMIGLRGRSFLVDNKRPPRLVDYALKTPVIVFHPGELMLVTGPASLRRTLLDRVLFHQDPAGASARLSYQLAMKDRQKLLLERGAHTKELDAYEQVAARYGARFALGRLHAAETMIESLRPAFHRMAAPGLCCEAKYQPGGATDVSEFAKELKLRRAIDLHRGAATFGPQRDDLALSLDGRPARSHASQGQQRILTLSLKMSELACVREVTGSEPILLLDDVSSELDPERTNSVFELLRESKSQIFVTTTRPELFQEIRLSGPLRADFRVSQGEVVKTSN